MRLQYFVLLLLGITVGMLLAISFANAGEIDPGFWATPSDKNGLPITHELPKLSCVVTSGFTSEFYGMSQCPFAGQFMIGYDPYNGNAIICSTPQVECQ